MLRAEDVMRRMQVSIARIRQYGVKRIGLFGSFDRKDEGPESDIDILVEFEPGEKTFDNYMDLKFFLEGLFERDVDLVIAEAVKAELREHILGSVRYASGL